MGVIVLSLFDGISCGRIALERAGIQVDKYYASEIDSYAEKISASNYPYIIRLGDITKWKEWNIEKPDIIIAGSPCQGFSFAGKGLNFEDPRSALFFVFADILRHYKPKYFLLENVKMKAEHNDVISSMLGEIYPERANPEMFRAGRIEPVLINSSLVSAQNRERLYWCNWKVTQPKDKNIFLKDIIETPGIGAIKNMGELTEQKEKSQCLDANYYKGIDNHGQRTMIITGGRITGRNPDNPKSRKAGLPTVQMMEKREDGKSGCLTTVQKDSVCVMIGKAEGIKGHDYNSRVYSEKGKSPSLCGASGGNLEPKISTDQITWRKLTVTECERLQTVPDGYCRAVSKSRAYHALGNGWTVEVIVHLFNEANI